MQLPSLLHRAARPQLRTSRRSHSSWLDFSSAFRLVAQPTAVCLAAPARQRGLIKDYHTPHQGIGFAGLIITPVMSHGTSAAAGTKQSTDHFISRRQIGDRGDAVMVGGEQVHVMGCKVRGRVRARSRARGVSVLPNGRKLRCATCRKKYGSPSDRECPDVRPDGRQSFQLRHRSLKFAIVHLSVSA